jgi:mono/diheme cytochrome c family protein
MRRRPAIWLAAAFLALASLGAIVARQHNSLHNRSTFLAGDPTTGGRLFETKGCSRCHALSGTGGHAGPDLGKVRPESPANLAQLVTTMWNHAPAMWQRMQQENLRARPLTEGEVSDLFAFLYVVRYLDEPGDVATGAQLFRSKGCIECHAVRGNGGVVGPDIATIAGVDTPIQWAQTLWNHAPNMEKNFIRVGVPWPRFEKNEMRDLLAYIREVSSGARSEHKLLPADPKHGAELFRDKGCLQCHSLQGQGGHVGPDLGAGRQSPLSMVGFAGEMWNHSPQMFREMNARGVGRPQFSGQDMADLMAFLNTLRYFEPDGSVTAGRGLFAARGCSRCHGANAEGGSLAPALRTGKGHMNSVILATALWRHGPEMYRQAQNLGMPWPKLSENDLGDLFAFLNSPTERSSK